MYGQALAFAEGIAHVLAPARILGNGKRFGSVVAVKPDHGARVFEDGLVWREPDVDLAIFEEHDFVGTRAGTARFFGSGEKLRVRGGC